MTNHRQPAERKRFSLFRLFSSCHSEGTPEESPFALSVILREPQATEESRFEDEILRASSSG